MNTKVNVTARPDGSGAVAFSYDKALVTQIKAEFPKARWDAGLRVWIIPGVRGYSRACAWAETVGAAELVAAKAAEQVRRDAEFEGRLHEIDPAAALAHRRAELRSKRVSVSGATVRYDFSYDSDSVGVARGMPNGVYSAGAWRWTAATMADVDAIIEGANRIYEIRLALTERQAEATEREQQAAVRDAESAARRASRWLVLATRAPAVGATVRLHGQIVTVESHGKPWTADENTPSISGLYGCEGESVRYAYYRPATPEEASAHEAGEADQAAARAQAQARWQAVDTVSRGELAPELGEVPKGEVLWESDAGAASGYRTWVVLADGWLYHVTYDGTDGAAWGSYNLGYNTVGRRVPATDALIAALRGGNQY